MVGTNYFLRVLIIYLIVYIGKDTKSDETRLIVYGVFVVQFFNTALLLLLVNANLAEQFTFLGKIFEGKLADFDSYWFGDLGKNLVMAMAYNTVFPMIEAGGFWGMRFGFRLLDRRFKTCNDNYTNKTTISQYVDLYSGPVFFIHYKYGTMLNVVYVTMMYGLGMPVLFPVAVVTLLIIYCTEKAMVYYSCRLPPMYDEKLNNTVLALMTYAPLLLLSFGYWMFSNHQLLTNEVYFKSVENSLP